MKADKTSDAYGDHCRLLQRDERIEQSQSMIVPCELCEGAWTTDDEHFPIKSEAIEHQYQILRGIL